MKNTLALALAGLLAACAVGPSPQQTAQLAALQQQCSASGGIYSPACVAYGNLQDQINAQSVQAQEANAAIAGFVAGALVGAVDAANDRAYYRHHRGRW